MFIRKRLNKPYNHEPYYTYQVCESYRVGKQVKQRVFCSLGSCNNPQAAKDEIAAKIERNKRLIAREELRQVSPSKRKSQVILLADCRLEISNLERKLKKIESIISQFP